MDPPKACKHLLQLNTFHFYCYQWLPFVRGKTLDAYVHNYEHEPSSMLCCHLVEIERGKSNNTFETMLTSRVKHIKRNDVGKALLRLTGQDNL